jgi:hypothetical protein
MLRCDECRAELLDLLYGLLDPAEEAAVTAHLADCPGCRTARADAERARGLLARAAKLPFPDVIFTPPAEVKSSLVRRSWVSWAVAAAVLFAVSLPAVPGWQAYRDGRAAADRAVAALDQAARDRDARRDEAAARRKAAADRVAAARAAVAAVGAEWATAAAAAPRPGLSVQVVGPTAARPGAPNEYAIRTTDAAGKPVAAKLDVTVVGRGGEVLARLPEIVTTQGESVDRPARPATLRLPADLWATLPPAADAFLAVTATDPTTKEAAALPEPVPLAGPVFVTFLVTDKPLYRPGEVVRFRSVTLDRAKFRPPAEDRVLRFELRKPDDTPVLDPLTGRTRAVTPAGDPVLGPDGKPVRGVACGAFALPADLPGGEYVLAAVEPGDDPTAKGTTVATRRLIVHRYTPDALQKTLEFDARTYGPGDPVRATVTVTDQGKPLAGVAVSAALVGEAFDTPPAVRTDAAGKAVLRFQLPPKPDLSNVSLSVEVRHNGKAETLVRRVPLATAKLKLEFFPEGGDLVEGVPCRVYFRAETAFGTPADVQGIVTDGTRTVAELKTLTDADHPGANQGLGVFTFTPEAGKRYAVKLLRPAGPARPDIPLPAAKPDGVVLAVSNGVLDANQPVALTVTSTTRRTLLVGAYTRGVAVGHRRVTAEPGRPTPVSIPVPAVAVGGVTRVTVFDQTTGGAVPVAERLVFRRPAEGLNLRIDAGDRPYTPGDRVTVDITATDETGKPAAAILWVAVVNGSVLTVADDRTERSLPTHFLLAGEVRRPEQLEHADFLLTRHPRAAEALDLLLGTQGWRRFAEQAAPLARAAAGPKAEPPAAFLAGAGPVPLAPGDPTAARFRPRLEAATADAAAAERAVARADEDARRAEREANAARDQAAADLRAAAGELLAAEDRLRASVWPLVLAAAGVVVLAARFSLLRRHPARGVLLAVGVSLVAAGGVQLAAPRLLGDEWRERTAGVAKAEPAIDTKPSPGRRPVVESFDPKGRPKPGDPRVASEPRAGLDLLPRPSAPPEAALAQLQADAGDPAARAEAEKRLAEQIELAVRGGKPGGRLTAIERESVDRVKWAVVGPGPFVVREYAHIRPEPPPGDATRTDFTETVIWHPLLVLPADGRASVSFQLGDSVAAHRVLVAGHTLDGRLGSTTGTIEVRKPLTVDAKLPPEISVGDRPTLAVVVSNATPTAADATLGVLSDGLAAADGPITLDVPAAGGARRLVPVRPTGVGPAKVRVSAAASGGRTDAVERTLNVVPEGFPVAGAVNASLDRTAKLAVTVPADRVPGTFRAKLTVFTSAAADLRAGIDGLLREPLGCFEQTSSANYPNLLVLDYLKRTGTADPAGVDRARQLLDRGYQRLASFEVPRKDGAGREGFEWFGQYPPHEALSAYGLAQFADMAKVYPVDPAVIDRTKRFLLSRRDGHGGFRRPPDGHTFGAVPEAVANAFVVWAITAADPAADVAKEASAAAAEATTSGDPYRLALAAATLLARGNADGAAPLLRTLAGKQSPDGGVPGAETSITRSGGPDLLVETTALAALAWMRMPRPNPFEANARSAVRFLAGRRGPGGAFGATQATVLALKALVEDAKLNPRTAAAGEVTVTVNGKPAGTRPLRSADAEPVVVEFDAADALFAAGTATVEVTSTAAGTYPVSVTWDAMTRTPAADPACPLALTTALDRRDLSEGQTARLTVSVANTAATDQGMVTAVVGLPAGLRPPADMKQFRDLSAKPAGGEAAISHWELSGRGLVLYWRGLGPKQTVTVPVDLVAETPGEYHGPASRAYLYYTPSAKVWVPPFSVQIK